MIGDGLINLIHEDVARYYSEKLAVHGVTAQGVDWKDEKSQQLRHRQFLRLIGGDRQSSIGDIGCGHGDFLRFLRLRNFIGRYVGCDVSETMIAAARKTYGTSPDHGFLVGPTLPEPADYVVASGIFNVRQKNPDDIWNDYMNQTIETMAQSARLGFGFNVLSLKSDPERRRPDLHYVDPVRLFEQMSARYGQNITLLRDYGLFEFTLLVWRS